MFLAELYEKVCRFLVFARGYRFCCSPQCRIETSAQLLSVLKLMTLILNIALDTQINSVITLEGNWLLIIRACQSE